MKKEELRPIIDAAQAIVNDVVANIKTMNSDELSQINVKLSGYFHSICGFHEGVKSGYIVMWAAIRKNYKSDKACDMFLLNNNDSAKMYDNLKYNLKGLEKIIKAIDNRLYELHVQTKT